MSEPNSVTGQMVLGALAGAARHLAAAKQPSQASQQQALKEIIKAIVELTERVEALESQICVSAATPTNDQSGPETKTGSPAILDFSSIEGHIAHSR